MEEKEQQEGGWERRRTYGHATTSLCCYSSSSMLSHKIFYVEFPFCSRVGVMQYCIIMGGCRDWMQTRLNILIFWLQHRLFGLPFLRRLPLGFGDVFGLRLLLVRGLRGLA